MDVSESEYNAYYSLDSQRDFEDFCEADIRQTMEPSRSGSSTRYRYRYSVVSRTRSAMNRRRRQSTDLQVPVT